jgi:molybdate transport system substrate-binding protein
VCHVGDHVKRRRLLALLAIVTTAALVLGARGVEAGNPDPIVVLAASSLKETLPVVAAAWTAKGHPPVSFRFDASSRLARQIEAGVPADAFVSADTDWMDALERKGLLVPGTRRDLVGNTLVAVVPAGSGLALASPSDLARPEVARLGLAGENVPAGKYGRAALRSFGVGDAVEGRVVNGDTVRTVARWVATEEVSAGIVYATDARVEPRVKVAFPFPAGSHPAIVYPMAVLKDAAHAREAASFLEACSSPEGRAVFLAAGFTAAPSGPSAP